MTATGGKSACTVRVTVKLRPEEYDELFRHVCEIGSTMSAFFRQSAARAMKGEHLDSEGGRHHGPLSPAWREHGTGDRSGGAAAACQFEPGRHEMTNLELSMDATLAELR
jgi:hypothetical protein